MAGMQFVRPQSVNHLISVRVGTASALCLFDYSKRYAVVGKLASGKIRRQRALFVDATGNTMAPLFVFAALVWCEP